MFYRNSQYDNPVQVIEEFIDDALREHFPRNFNEGIAKGFLIGLICLAFYLNFGLSLTNVPSEHLDGKALETVLLAFISLGGFIGLIANIYNTQENIVLRHH